MTTEINTCPVETAAQYTAMRETQGTGAIIPCAGEPIVIRYGHKVVYASNGVVRGYYSYDTDIFTPDLAPEGY